MARSIHQRGPLSAAKWLTNRMLPPGRTTRRISASSLPRMRHHRGHEHRHRDVERGIREIGRLGVHLAQRLDVGDAEFGDPLFRLGQHFGGQVDAGDPLDRQVMRQREAGADADFQDAAAGHAIGQAPRRGAGRSPIRRRTRRHRCRPNACRRRERRRHPGRHAEQHAVATPGYGSWCRFPSCRCLDNVAAARKPVSVVRLHDCDKHTTIASKG